MTSQSTCYIGIDVGLTATKAAAFGRDGAEIAVASTRTPRTCLTAHAHVVDMTALEARVLDVLTQVAGKLAAAGHRPGGIGVTGHGNGLYPVTESLAPAGAAIASSDSRARDIVAGVSAGAACKLAAETGSIPWAAQPSVLLRWLHDCETATYQRTRWALSCKDWVTSRLTGQLSADFSDASAAGLVALDSRRYTPFSLEMLGLPAADLDRFPPLRRSDEIVGGLTGAAAAATGLPAGLPVIAGCLDCIAATLGAGGREPGDVTVIVGTWAINGVVVPARTPAPQVTVSGLMPDITRMLAMEVAPTSASNLEWLAGALVPAAAAGSTPVADLLADAAAVPAGAEGVLFLPFVNGAPEHPAASGTWLGISSVQRRGHLVRAVIEGVAQYHRVQLDRVLASGAAVADRPWRLAGGGARSTLWAQIFADVLGRPVRRQLASELGARGVASLLPGALGEAGPPWATDEQDDLCVHPSPDQAAYQRQAAVFDRCLAALPAIWSDIDRYREGSPLAAPPVLPAGTLLRPA